MVFINIGHFVLPCILPTHFNIFVKGLLRFTFGGTLKPKDRPTFCKSRLLTSNTSLKP